MISEKFITSIIAKIILTVELSLSQFIWKIDINQGILSRNDYIVWSMFNHNIMNIYVYERIYFPYLAMIAAAIAGIQIITDKNANISSFLQRISLAVLLTILGTYFIRYSMEIIYLLVSTLNVYMKNLPYYFSDSYMVSQMTNNLEASNSYALIFFSAIYTVSGIELGIFLMLRLGILIAFSFFLPFFSFSLVFQKGREIMLKLWLLFIETSLFPLMIIPLLYIYINLSHDSFAQLGILIFVVATPALFSMGIYRTASSTFSSVPYIVQAFSPETAITYAGDLPGKSMSEMERREMSLSASYPEANIERFLGGTGK